MTRGKQTCKILKEIRRQIAQANDIEFVTEECRYKGDCLGTCPKCEAEVRYLEQQLRARSLAGRLINLAGISAGAIALLSPVAAQAQTPAYTQPMDEAAVHTQADTIIVKGVVLSKDMSTLTNGKISEDPFPGAVIYNERLNKWTVANDDGGFEIQACKGDTLRISYIGMQSEFIVITDETPLNVVLTEETNAMSGEVVVANFIVLHIVNQRNKPIPLNDVLIEEIYTDEDGNVATNELKPYWADEGKYELSWGNSVKEATLRITAKGYEKPVIVKAYNKGHNTKKTVKFTHSKK